MYPPVTFDGQFLQFPLGQIKTVSGTSVVRRFNLQTDDIFISSIISGCSYGVNVDTVEAWYNASGVQTRLALLAGMRLAVTTAIGANVYATVISGASTAIGDGQYLRLLSSGIGQDFLASTISPELLKVNFLLANDGSGVTVYQTPFIMTAASNSWYQLAAPANTISMCLQSSSTFRISEFSTYTGGFKMLAATPYYFPVNENSKVFMRSGAADTTLQYYFVCVE